MAQTKKCKKCKKIITVNKFIKGNDEGYDFWCTPCRKKFVKNLDRLMIYLKENGRIFNQDLWNTCIGIANERFKDMSEEEVEAKTINFYFSKMNLLGMDGAPKVDTTSDEYLIEKYKEEVVDEEDFDLVELKTKFGYGYQDDDYVLFEKKYQQLRPSFQLVTTMHEECLREYCINKVKENQAKAKGDFKEAKEWASMAQAVATSGKLNPSQMSKADLTGGMDTFGQLVRMVEEEVDIIPLLPKFVEQPKDKVDIVLWHFVNYVRDLKGLPECEYKDIYEFYEKRRMDYENNMSDNELLIDSSDING